METQGAYADILLDNTLRKSKFLNPVDRAFITELVYGILRWQKRIDWVIDQFSKIPIQRLDSNVLNIIRLGTYQLLFLSRVPAFAAVNESVELAKLAGHRGSVKFVNANLRAIDKKRDLIEFPDMERDPELHIAVVYSYPLWMVKRWLGSFGLKDTIALCKSSNNIPPLTIRTNTLRVSRQELLEELRKDVKEVSLTPYCHEGIKITGGGDVTVLPSFAKGWFQAQDEASQLVSHVLAPQPGEMILDTCSAPGGKTTHTAQLMENSGEIFALDINKSRLTLLEKNCKRLGITNVTALHYDSSIPLEFGEKFHRILVDAPCSGVGTLRRNPDGKWRKKEEDIISLRRLQLGILENVADYLRKGGVMVYSTCTITPEENEEVVAAFLANRPEFDLDDTSGVLPSCCESFIDGQGFFRSYPHIHNTDGFFAARLKKEYE